MANPGSTRSELAKQHAVTWHAVSYHVDDLINEGVVGEIRNGAKRHLFHVSAPQRSVGLIQRGASTILEALANRPQRIVEIGRKTGMGRKQVASVLVHLRRDGLVELCADGRYKVTCDGLANMELVPVTAE